MSACPAAVALISPVYAVTFSCLLGCDATVEEENQD
jgi:hypothetical protein